MDSSTIPLGKGTRHDGHPRAACQDAASVKMSVTRLVSSDEAIRTEVGEIEPGVTLPPLTGLSPLPGADAAPARTCQEAKRVGTALVPAGLVELALLTMT